ncbi:uncharacterized protein LOC103846090 isoform X1 [Brassica rapa]|uniref:uncharacterized protein LOC103846090 isoform X1 n=1 Tax=Brassica campestris TaxID=3711 RepID=UPI00142DE79C|nr:uncharacterized protein LOC103846090 isoform X1 [Brassica rapa]
MMMVTAPLCPLFRPPPDPPPYKFLPLASLSLVTPPEPPDPPDVPAVVALLRYLNTSSSLFPLAMTQNPDLDFPSLTPESRGCDVPFLLLGVSSVVFGCIFSIPSTQAFTQISTLKPPSRMATKNGGGGGSPVSASDTSLPYGFLSPVIYSMQFLYGFHDGCWCWACVSLFSVAGGREVHCPLQAVEYGCGGLWFSACSSVKSVFFPNISSYME